MHERGTGHRLLAVIILALVLLLLLALCQAVSRGPVPATTSPALSDARRSR